MSDNTDHDGTMSDLDGTVFAATHHQPLPPRPARHPLLLSLILQGAVCVCVWMKRQSRGHAKEVSVRVRSGGWVGGERGAARARER
eukprot:2483106-Rhodomonas_salina.1